MYRQIFFKNIQYSRKRINEMKEKIQFPKDFWWGAATSGPQSEGWYGKRHENVMDYWYRVQRNDFFNGVGPDVASDFYHKYKDDFAMCRQIGMNSFRSEERRVGKECRL